MQAIDASPVQARRHRLLAGHGETRRGFLLAVAASATLAACGFHLRGQATYAFKTIYVNAPAYPQLQAELRRVLAGSGSATLAETPQAAEVIIDITQVIDDKQLLSLSPAGRVQEYALEKHVLFRVRDQEGQLWLADSDIVIRRSYSYDDTERLAREIQEQRLVREMQIDAVHQIVRRLESARPPA